MKKWSAWIKSTNGFVIINNNRVFTKVDVENKIIYYHPFRYRLREDEFLVDVTNCEDFEKLKEELQIIHDIIC